MDEILENKNSKKAGVLKPKKTSLLVDLTPMVDLGFLLISFFIFTTTMSQPTAMSLNMPDDRSIDSSQVPQSKTINLILGANNVVYAFNGDNLNNMESSKAQKNFIRFVVLQKKDALRRQYGSDSDMVVLIKPTADATYAAIVNALDEMKICSVKTYVLMDASSLEVTRIKNQY